MLFHIDDVKISMDLQKLSDGLENWYKANKQYGYYIETEKGKIDFSPKSLARIALKAAMAPISLPMIKFIYKAKNAEPKPHDKHEDLIDYFVLSFIRYIALFNGDKLYVTTMERADSDERIVSSVSTALPRKSIEGPAAEEKSEEGCTGGATYVRGGENGNGENETDKGDNKEKDTSPALAERVPHRHEEKGGLLRSRRANVQGRHST